MKKYWKHMLSLLLAAALLLTVVPTNTSAASKVKLNKTKATVYVGGTVTLKLTGTKKTAQWSTSNKSVATVSKKGVVAGKKKGSAKITATVGKKSYTCKLTVKRIEKTAVQSQKARYTELDKAGTYNKKIITDKILNSCTLGEVDKANLPYWNGFVSETRIYTNATEMMNWNQYTPGFNYFSEEEIAFLAKKGFNCYRILYSFSWLSNPNNANEVNVSELEQLDEVISWCAKYNLHCMISITGLPGKKGRPVNEEGVFFNSEAFTDSKMEKLFGDYFKLLSKRYAALPSGLLSFELMAEPQPSFNEEGADMDKYCEVLGRIAKNIWEDNDKRIVIAMDICGELPEELARLGCCISKHNHVYAVDGSRLRELGIDYTGTWPMQYLPAQARNGVMRLCSETEFSAGTYTLYVSDRYGNYMPTITCDGVAAETVAGETGKGAFTFTIKIPEGTKEIAWKLPDDGGFPLLMMELKQNGKETIRIASHSMYGCGELEDDVWPTIEVKDDGSLQNLSGQKLDAEQLYNSFFKQGDELAKKYGVSYILTEVGTDTVDLSVNGYLAYHGEMLKALKNHNLGWMYNCAHNIFGPKDSIWLNGVNGKIPFKNFTEWKNTPYYYNADVVDLLQKYQ